MLREGSIGCHSRRGRGSYPALASRKNGTDYRILGPLEVRDGGWSVALGSDKQRALLAILVLHCNEVVSADRLIDELRGESPPASALRTLQA
jgi:DNA-binding SARP family transcriptional activator